MGRSTNTDWNDWRGYFPVVERLAYFDNAAVAPLSIPARDAIRRWSDESVALGDTAWTAWVQRVEEVRRTVAELIGAETAEIALVPNTTSGITLVAEGFPWREGDNVVIPANEFPSNAYPWLNLERRGVETRQVAVASGRLEIDDFAELCDERTRVIAASWIGYASGWRLDVGQLVEFAHARGILVSLDAIQGLGVFPLDVEDTQVDFVAADGHKWMLGPEGAGILYIRGEHLDLLRPFHTGWNSVVHRHDYGRIELKLRREAARYEGGSQNIVGFIGLGASLDLLRLGGLNKDTSAIARRVLEITDCAAEQLRKIGAEILSCRDEEHASGIVSFQFPGHESKQLREACLEANVILSFRGGALRISPHAYNNEEDVHRLLDVLRTAMNFKG